MKYQFASFLTLTIIGIACSSSTEQKQEPIRGMIANQAVIVSAHGIASEVGKDILMAGGNAFDAAVATHFALAVVYPQAGNIGGGGFAVFRQSNGEIGALDYREKAPRAASKNMYLDNEGNIIKGKSTTGHEAMGVPGSVDGMIKLHATHGVLNFSDLIAPAIQLAQAHIINKTLAQLLNRFDSTFRAVNLGKTSHNKTGTWQPGDTLVNPALAETLIRIQQNGREGFYSGETANLIVNESQSGGGLITHEDLMKYESQWRTPLIGMYKGHKIITMPPPSSGGIALLQLLQGAAFFDFKKTGHNTAQTIHEMVEIERRVYADRATYLGDPDFVEIPDHMLLSEDYNKERFSTIKLDQATPSSDIKEGKIDIIESEETTHFSIIDKEGNAVSITTTLNSWFGSKVEVKGAGFFMNNEMDDFSAKPGTPNQFGLVGNEANAIAPEKRMLSSMTPTLVEKDGKTKMVVGTPGGAKIITSVYQVIVNVIDHDMTMQEAVNAPKFHSQWLPDEVYFEEEKFSSQVLKSLQEKGHVTKTKEKIGKLECILVLDDGKLEGAPDHTRNESAAAGY